jgi:DNA ligase D-like protein (predicted 3'-phosphoesterase)
MSLDAYRRKRDFRRSSEPEGGTSPGSDDHRFVIQEHDASTHHYDFRLEVDGVLKSWAVPKGPSTDPFEKRLAVRTEDHPLDYIDFEGVIPEGEYGAGPVIVWDTGTWEDLKKDDDGHPVPLTDQLADGHATFRLHGEKVSGGYALIRTDMDDGDERWLLIKMDDEDADARRNPTSTEPESVKSGHTIDEVREQEGAKDEAEEEGEGS